MGRTYGDQIDRRGLLRMLGSIAGVAALAGCGSIDDDGEPITDRPPSDGTPEVRDLEDETEIGTPAYKAEFDTILNVVDIGADPTGVQSIIPIIDGNIDDDTLFTFPEGNYLIDDLWFVPEYSNIGFVGDGATIVPEPGYSGHLIVIGAEGNPTGCLFERFTFDFDVTDTAPRPIQIAVNDNLLLRDVSVVGTTGTVRVDITDTDGHGIVERLNLPDGDIDGVPGCLVGNESYGFLEFIDCTIENFSNNGLYASPSHGPVHVLGGSYQNNAIANVRVSNGGVVKGVHVRCDSPRTGFTNLRGIRLRDGDSATIEDCTIEIIDVPGSDGGIVVESLMKSATIKDTRIVSSADNIPALNIKTMDDSLDVTDAHVHCENLDISGSAGNGSAVRVAERTECAFEGLCIQQTGEDRNGIFLLRSENVRINNTEINVTGEPFVIEGSTSNMTNIVITPGEESITCLDE